MNISQENLLHNNNKSPIFASKERNIMIADRTTRKQAGWRVLPVLIERVKEAARRENISTNDFVEKTLLQATKDIETEMEKKMRLKRNEDFLSAFAGKWSGKETAEEITDSIKKNDSKDIYTL